MDKLGYVLPAKGMIKYTFTRVVKQPVWTELTNIIMRIVLSSMLKTFPGILVNIILHLFSKEGFLNW
jgi:hypothetical protein